MSRLQSIRLAQFWRLRLRPLVTMFEEKQVALASDTFEAIGWLIEGVFCGFFDPNEADVLWVRTSPLLGACGSPSRDVISGTLLADLHRLQNSDDPFRRSAQMPDGPQKRLELPLYPHALLLADRLANDPLARICISAIRNNELWERLKVSWDSVEPSDVADVLGAKTCLVSIPLAWLRAMFDSLIIWKPLDLFSDIRSATPHARVTSNPTVNASVALTHGGFLSTRPSHDSASKNSRTCLSLRLGRS